MGKKIEWKKFSETIREAIPFLKHNMDLIQKMTLPVVVALAVIVFWISGGAVSETKEDAAAETDETVELVQDKSDMIYVDIGGEVENPGVYQIAAGTRLFQVIEKAGGLKEAAATDAINQAEPVVDGQKIMIGSMDVSSPYYIGTTPADTSAVRMTQDGVRININRAALEELQMIPGVGPSTAQKIIDYRNENGSFTNPEDLKKISGIGEKTYENLKDYIET